jgi:uncharacterized protein (TIGR00299 family) protein
MSTLYFECRTGAAGDMLMAALLELDPDPADFLREMNHLGLPGVKVTASPCLRRGISGTHIDVQVDGIREESGLYHEHGRHLGEIQDLLNKLPLSQKVRTDAQLVYESIAQAESQVHGCPVDQIHFHEVGTLDAVTDVVGVCLLMERLHPDRVLCSPVHVGGGMVRCAHGLLPVPAPATERILRGIPICSGPVECELCTPTGAALLRHFVQNFGEMPAISVSRTGYGMGTRELETVANCVRAFWGVELSEAGQVCELRCNLDDMTPEEIGFAQERLFENGALDVYTVALGMKKNRPGIALCCMCKPEDERRLTACMFRHTTTLGIRVSTCKRVALPRTEKIVDTKFGPVRVKTAEGQGFTREKAEYEDLAALAQKQGVNLREMRELL